MGWTDWIGPAIGAGAGILGSVLGGNAQADAYGQAAGASNYAADRAYQAQMEALGIMRADTAPLRNLLPSALSGLTGQAGASPTERGYMNQYGQIPLPQLQSNVNMDFGADPIFQAQMDEMTKQLNRRFASQGRAYSSGADDAMTRNALPFMESAYGRGVDTLNRQNTNALTNYQLGTNRAQTLYGMEGALGDQRWGRNLDLAKLGAGAAAAAGQGAQTTGNALSSIFQNQGNNLAGIYAGRGQNTAQMYGNMAGSIQGGYNNYLLGQYLTPQASSGPGSIGAGLGRVG